MAVALANALRKSWFAYTNNEKGQNLSRADHLERKVTSYCQDVGAAGELVNVAKDTTKGARCFNTLAATMKATETSSKLFEYTGKAVNLAGQAVNPILCVASAARALSEDDKKSAIIQEVGAMSGMFLFEGVTKQALGLTKDTGLWSKFCGGIAKNITKAVKATGLISKLPNNKYTGILKGITFVAASCAGFGLGHDIGKVITKNTTEKDFQLKKLQMEQAQIAKLTAAQNGTKADIVS